MILTVRHQTTHRYDRPVRGVVQSHRLHPARFDGQRVIAWSVDVAGGVKGGGFRDGADDFIQAWTVPGPVDQVSVTVQGTVETQDLAGVLRGHRDRIPPEVWLRKTPATRCDVAMTDLAQGVAPGQTGLDLAHELARAVASAVRYDQGATTAQTTAAEALALGAGVCQDHAQVLIGLARTRALPARYAVGYMLADPNGTLAQAAHAWAEVWVAGLGWVGFDAANGCCPDARYIRLGCGFDAADAAPIRGAARGEATDVRAEVLDVTLQVTVADGQQQQ